MRNEVLCGIEETFLPLLLMMAHHSGIHSGILGVGLPRTQSWGTDVFNKSLTLSLRTSGISLMVGRGSPSWISGLYAYHHCWFPICLGLPCPLIICPSFSSGVKSAILRAGHGLTEDFYQLIDLLLLGN